MTPHGSNTHVKAYLMVFATLGFLTIVTVLISYLHLPMKQAIILAIVVASIKAGLVAAYFMHLKGEKILIYGILILTILLTTLFALTILDFKLLSSRSTQTSAHSSASSGH